MTAHQRRVPATDGPKVRFVELADVIARFVRARPVPALAAALSAGFVVGGALSFRAGRMLLSAGVRQGGQQLLKQML